LIANENMSIGDKTLVFPEVMAVIIA